MFLAIHLTKVRDITKNHFFNIKRVILKNASRQSPHQFKETSPIPNKSIDGLRLSISEHHLRLLQKVEELEKKKRKGFAQLQSLLTKKIGAYVVLGFRLRGFYRDQDDLRLHRCTAAREEQDQRRATTEQDQRRATTLGAPFA